MTKANKNNVEVAAEVSTKEVSQSKMMKYIRAKKEQVASGNFEVVVVATGKKMKCSEIKLDENNLPIVIKDEAILYKNVPVELFGTSKLGKSLRFKYLALVEQMRIQPLLDRVEAIKAKIEKFENEATLILVEPTEEEKKEAKRQRLLAQLAELED